MDNGKLRLWPYKKATILEIYNSGELVLLDINTVLASLYQTSKPPYLIIIVRTGNYRLSFEAKIRLLKEKRERFKIAYVVKEPKTMQHAFHASRTYLKRKDVYICDSIDSAYKALTAANGV
jgi:sulfopyruvate decarboxylase TPP-binding subunit